MRGDVVSENERNQSFFADRFRALALEPRGSRLLSRQNNIVIAAPFRVNWVYFG